jgi:hypothetical protein
VLVRRFEMIVALGAQVERFAETVEHILLLRQRKCRCA